MVSHNEIFTEKPTDQPQTAGYFWVSPNRPRPYLTSKVKELGYVINAEDPCVFSKLVNGTFLDLFIYVDDILMSHADKNILNQEAKRLGSCFAALRRP